MDSFKEKAPGLGVGEVHYRVGTTYYRLREYGKALEALEEALRNPGREQETEALSAFLSARIHEEQGDPEKARQLYLRVVEKAPDGDTMRREIAHARKKLR